MCCRFGARSCICNAPLHKCFCFSEDETRIENGVTCTHYLIRKVRQSIAINDVDQQEIARELPKDDLLERYECGVHSFVSIAQLLQFLFNHKMATTPLQFVLPIVPISYCVAKRQHNSKVCFSLREK